ncbi:IS66 family insertion sequence element accessory protein TnpA [Gemmata sp.]|uniref:IS66 family insertion sequence element accessory protein TnpA n=1 Tax=Gemmata sp. TaxID=1914242 RepID=UPI003F6F9376
MPNRRPDPARERQWRKRLARWKGSGLKISAFCAREGVTPTALAHWRKEIAARDARAAGAGTPEFVPVHMTPPGAVGPIEVVLADGRVVRVPPGFDPAHLRAVVAALEGFPC